MKFYNGAFLFIDFWYNILHMKQLHPCRVYDLGCVSFTQAYRFQMKRLQDVCDQGVFSLIFCEHTPIFTLGRLSDSSHILVDKQSRLDLEIDLSTTNRGGEVTFHGPGQLVIYPIIDLHHYGKDLKMYMLKLEQVLIELLVFFDIKASKVSSRRGVWIKSKKIASIGIGAKKWISLHGAALNVNTNMEYFTLIKPCGLDVAMTSLKEIMSREVSMSLVKSRFMERFKDIFQVMYLNQEGLYG